MFCRNRSRNSQFQSRGKVGTSFYTLLPAVKINGVPFVIGSLGEESSQSCVGIFDLRTLKAHSCVRHSCIIRRYGVFMSLFCTLLGLFHVNYIEISE